MLEGKELIEKAKLLSKKSEDEIAKGCGYVGPSGRILRKSFYRALIEAKGYKIGNGRQGKNGNRASRGRQTEFKTTLMDELDEEENQEQIKLELSKTFENIEETQLESKRLETSSSNGIFSKDKNSNNIKQLSYSQKLPLPNIKNLRKWINNDKKAS